jgi:hypothetical protein
VTTFFLLSELASYLKQSLDASTATLAAEAAAEEIRKELRQTVDLVSNETVTLTARGEEVLYLPEVPVITLTSVVVGGRTFLSSEYELDKKLGTLRRVLVPATTDSPAGYGIWWDGQQVTVTYTHGYATIPTEIKSIALELAGDQYTSALGKLKSRTVTTGSDTYSETYSDSSGGSHPDSYSHGLSESQMRRLDPFRPPSY